MMFPAGKSAHVFGWEVNMHLRLGSHRMSAVGKPFAVLPEAFNDRSLPNRFRHRLLFCYTLSYVKHDIIIFKSYLYLFIIYMHYLILQVFSDHDSRFHTLIQSIKSWHGSLGSLTQLVSN